MTAALNTPVVPDAHAAMMKRKPKKPAAKKRVASTKPKPPKAAKGKRGEEHMSVRVVTADKRRFIALCKERECPQSEMFRRFVAALGRAGKKTRVVTIRITGYSPV